MIEWLIGMFFLAVVQWFFFYLLNYAEITRPAANWLKRVFGPKVGYPLSCGMCWPFWVTLALYVLYPDFVLLNCFVVPVMHLFVDLAYQRLGGNCPPCVEESK